MAKTKRSQFGGLKPKYSFILNPYIGTVEKKAWREGMKQSKAVNEMLPHVSGFVTYYKELRMTQPGWFRANQEPPVMEPPESQEWVKSKTKHRR